MECTQNNPGDAFILPPPMFWAGKNPEEIGCVGDSKDWLGLRTITARVVKMLETTLQQ